VDEKEKNALVKKLSKKKGNISISRFKGLGEMNPSQLRETVMNPDERKLVRLTVGNGEAAMNMFNLLLSKKMAAGRNNWIQTKGNVEDIQ
jgi:topoisomerase-4 subunit B